MKSEDVSLPNIERVSQEQMMESPFKSLEPHQQRFIHMYLSGDYTIPKIASVLGYHPDTLRRWLRKPEFKAVLDEYQNEETEIVTQTLMALRLKALYKMSDLMNSPVDGIAYQAARDVLDRTGFKATQKQDVKIEVYNYETQIKEILGNDIDLIEADYKIEGDE
ncbi:MAG: hypothetical protein PHY47_12865 [Lachnospiraceae bacterium]|nr:hypothetical protein [Lachnospiraceae bacterium]